MKDAKYLKFVRSLPSCISGQSPCHAHHIIGHGQGGMGMKSCDYFAMPLTHEEHHELHQHGWKQWEDKYGSQWRFVAQTLRNHMMENENE